MSAPSPESDAGRATATRRRPVRLARERLNLIEQITSDAVASDYVLDEPDPARQGSTRRERRMIAALALGFVGFLLAVGVSARILNAPIVAEQKQALRERIETEDALQDRLLAETLELRDQVETARAEELERVAGGARVNETLAELELVTGYTAVRGPGVVVTLEDAPVVDGEEPEELERVLDSDVQLAVNGLWAAGAEAMAVNGSRLTASSAIRSAADAILVNYRPLRPPYRVEAIGPEAMLDTFLASGDAAELRAVSQQFGIGFAAQAEDTLALAAATSALPETAEVVTTQEGVNP